ncbi:MAG TPA: metallophosphoesterase [Vicinamibacteria bacterium]|nr:metallophosphoesterase [Vicinamibacteria bacterium]
MTHRLAARAAALLLLLPAVARGADRPCAFEGVERVVAVGDVHGAYDRYVALLRAAGLVDGKQKWKGGKAHLVQVGDVVDRGPDSRKVLDLLKKLEGQAEKAGGRVHLLIGNHEVMRMLGDRRYAHPGEYAAFATGRSKELRERALERVPEAERERVRAETPLGLLEMAAAFGPEGHYGKWLRGLNAVVRINGVVFLHGGISPATGPLSCEDINATIRNEIAGDLLAAGLPPGNFTTREDGPLWYRGLAREPETFAPTLDAILLGQKARAIVVGHTVSQDGTVKVRFGGKVLTIDTGMQTAYVPTGTATAVEIVGDTVTAVDEKGRRTALGRVPDPPAPTAAGSGSSRTRSSPG